MNIFNGNLKAIKASSLGYLKWMGIVLQVKPSLIDRFNVIGSKINTQYIHLAYLDFLHELFNKILVDDTI